MGLPRYRERRGRGAVSARQRIRYAVVGLGHIAQDSILPGFTHAQSNSELVALFSDDRRKLRQFGKTYGVEGLYDYSQFEEGLREADVDAVYIALPNHLHAPYTIRAAREGVHILCEKPMAVTPAECRRMISECRRNGVKLMTAYRLHFEPANLEAIELVHSGKLGEPRVFGSLFSFQVAAGNIRLKPEKGGGPLYDIGIYCINAARYLFQAEPTEVMATAARGRDRRFKGIEEACSAVMRFPGERLASFTCSFGATAEARYEVLCTKGSVRLSNAYEYEMPIEVEIQVNDQRKVHKHAKRDQFGPEMSYFSNCILRDKEPEPSGEEGLNDVEIIQALYRSIRSGRMVKVPRLARAQHPTGKQRFSIPPAAKPKLLHVEAPARD